MGKIGEAESISLSKLADLLEDSAQFLFFAGVPLGRQQFFHAPWTKQLILKRLFGDLETH